MMAETYTQNADGSDNPTGEVEPAEAPITYEGQAGPVVGKVVESPERDKPKGQTRASKASKKA